MVAELIEQKYDRNWKAKYDLQEPAELPPMKIILREGAKPAKINRHYNWTQDQRDFLRMLLRKLVDGGIISRVDSEWCCPVVLVIKPDMTWRLFVDPSALNKATVPMVWDIPKVRELIQENLKGVQWMSKFDFSSMFWQIPLHEDSRKLFAFYAGEFGTYGFNRVAMGALNSSIYTQKMVTHMFQNVKRKDGKPLLGNGLMIQTDDVLLYSRTEEEMVEILELFLHVVACHKMAINPWKTTLFAKDVVFCGLRITREGIAVDPERIKGLLELPEPKNLGDVWQFVAAAGWIRDEIPLFSEAAAILTELRVQAMQGCKRKNMAAARRIKLKQAGWSQAHQRAWETIKAAMLQTITTAYKDRRKQACLFTDTSKEGWAYVITQCEVGEVEKPWQEQVHEILAVNSGKFRQAQAEWHINCKEAYPIRRAVEKHRHILLGDVPFLSINDHRTLKYIFNEPARTAAISVASRDRLRRSSHGKKCSHVNIIYENVHM